MSTGEKGKIDEHLVTGLKDAKSHRCHFACVMASSKKGLLLISKTKIPGPAIAAAKKECGGTQTVEGECLYENGGYVFEMADEPDQQLAGAVKLFAKNQTTQTIKVACRSNLALRAQTQPTRPLPPIPNAPGGTNTNQPGTTPNQPQRQQPGSQQPQPNQQTYTDFHDWRQKILQVDHATVPATQKRQAYTKLANDLQTETTRLAQDQTIDPNAKTALETAQRAAKDLLALRSATATNRANHDQRIGVLAGPRKAAFDRAENFAAPLRGEVTKADDANLNMRRAEKDKWEAAKTVFSKQSIDDMADKTDASDSKFGSIILAMRVVQGAESQSSGRNPKLPFDELLKVVAQLESNAQAYRDSHKGAITPLGKKRVKQCDVVLEALKSMKEVAAKSNDIYRPLIKPIQDELARGGASPQIRDAIEELLRKAPVSGAEMQQLKALHAQVLQTLKLKNDQLMANRQNVNSVEHAEVLLQNGGSKPPGGKGQSDSFFITNPDGSPAFMFKPLEGEARNNIHWTEGGGASREILASGLSDLLLQETGIDFKVAKTTLMKTDHGSFSKGTLSKSPQRVGALQDLIKTPGDGINGPFDMQHNLPPSQYKASYDSFNTDDVESMAILDLITLNSDRHCDNVLLQNVGQQPNETRFSPIDAGQMLPKKGAFATGAKALLSPAPFNPNDIHKIEPGENMITQMPHATKPFSQKAKDAIAKLDPDKFVRQMQGKYENLVSEAPEMGGKVEDECFDLMKRSIRVLKLGAAADLTPRQISYLTATVLPGVMDASDGAFTKAIQDGIADLKRINDLGGELKLMEMGFAKPADWPLAVQRQILEGNLSVQDGKKANFAHLQTQLADLPQYLLFENNAKFQLGDLLTRPFSDVDYTFLETAKDYKTFGGDPVLRKLLSGEPNLIARNLSLPLAKKIPAYNHANTIYKRGGFVSCKEQMGDEEYKQAVLTNDLQNMEFAMKGN